MHKVREAMKSRGNNPIDGIVHVDESVVGEQEQSNKAEAMIARRKSLFVL